MIYSIKYEQPKKRKTCRGTNGMKRWKKNFWNIFIVWFCLCRHCIRCRAQAIRLKSYSLNLIYQHFCEKFQKPTKRISTWNLACSTFPCLSVGFDVLSPHFISTSFRLFCIVCSIFFCKLLCNYENVQKWKENEEFYGIGWRSYAKFELGNGLPLFISHLFQFSVGDFLLANICKERSNRSNWRRYKIGHSFNLTSTSGFDLCTFWFAWIFSKSSFVEFYWTDYHLCSFFPIAMI